MNAFDSFLFDREKVLAQHGEIGELARRLRAPLPRLIVREPSRCLELYRRSASPRGLRRFSSGYKREASDGAPR